VKIQFYRFIRMLVRFLSTTQSSFLGNKMTVFQPVVKEWLVILPTRPGTGPTTYSA